MKIDTVKVGRMLMELRGERTLKEVATALKISEPAIRHYESGIRTPNDNVKFALARYYERSVTDIFFAFFKRSEHDPDDTDPQDEPS